VHKRLYLHKLVVVATHPARHHLPAVRFFYGNPCLNAKRQYHQSQRGIPLGNDFCPGSDDDHYTSCGNLRYFAWFDKRPQTSATKVAPNQGISHELLRNFPPCLGCTVADLQSYCPSEHHCHMQRRQGRLHLRKNNIRYFCRVVRPIFNWSHSRQK